MTPEQVMKKCQIGYGGRSALNDCHDLLPECYGTIGMMLKFIETEGERNDTCTKPVTGKVGDSWAGDIPEDLSKCPQCGGDADNGHDRCLPPSAYLCSKCSELLNAEILGVEAVPCNDGLDIVREE